MRKCVNGVYMDMIYEELENIEIVAPPEYKDRVINSIRAVYSVDDELAILRQRDTKPDEFAEYNTFVEKVKAEEKQYEVNLL